MWGVLTHLHIRNYALIDSLSIELRPGFSVITGETGSGKSILLGALSLILGKRADTSVLRDAGSKCIVEVTCKLKGWPVGDFFEEHDLDYDDHCTIRREISPAGKSRAFINDTPVNLQQLRELGSLLVDIHSQHETLNLKDNSFQLAVLDDFAGLTSRVEAFTAQFKEWRTLHREMANLREHLAREREQRDFLDFQLNELEEAQLTPGEEEQLQSEIALLEHAEEIKLRLVQCTEMLIDSDENVAATLRNGLQQLASVRSHDKGIDELFERLQSASIEIKDIGEELARQEQLIEVNPSRLQQLQERLDMLNGLMHKHQASNVAALLDKMDAIAQKLEGEQSREEKLELLKKQIAEREEDLQAQSAELTVKRKEAAPQLAQKLCVLLERMELKNAEMSIAIESLSKRTSHGDDWVQLLLRTNKGQELMPIEQVASGGELSRVMLAIKSVNTGQQFAPTLILDEIDNGVSGRVADAMAQLLAEMGGQRQMICITHLPQIAAKGQWHYRVSKRDEADRTHTFVEELNEEARLHEVAAMLSGSDTTEAALQNARMLMNAN
ncbi:MAG: DNA repair protein RecN [Cryomorphaceae bacterium]|nr:MAG: DNA repair protein RecN [Cryomorphaceae bacterium]